MYGIGKLIEMKYGKPHSFIPKDQLQTGIYDIEKIQIIGYTFKCSFCGDTLTVNGKENNPVSAINLKERISFAKLYGCNRNK